MMRTLSILEAAGKEEHIRVLSDQNKQLLDLLEQTEDKVLRTAARRAKNTISTALLVEHSNATSFRGVVSPKPSRNPLLSRAVILNVAQ